eukprot:scaffold22802_cov23-Cyclotella_meneghiniana.AAC.1
MSQYPVQQRSSSSIQKPLWDLTPIEIESWVRSLSPGAVNTGGMLFPKPLVTSSAAAAAAAATNSAAEDSSKSDKDAYQARLQVGNILLGNLVNGLRMASAGTSSHDGSAAKKAKTQHVVVTAQKGCGD